MQNILLIIQIVVGIVLSSAILLQVKGTGFGRVWGGLSVSSSRRGIEGIVFKATFILSAVFLITAIAGLLV